MKLSYTSALALVFFNAVFSSTVLASQCDSTCQLTQVKAYFSALDTVSRQGSSAQDIEDLLALTHDDVKYIHVEYEANFTKDTWREAFNRNLKRGAYKNGSANEIRVLDAIHGKNHTAIKYSHGMIQKDGSWQKKDAWLVLFGFTDGKISLIKELW